MNDAMWIRKRTEHNTNREKINIDIQTLLIIQFDYSFKDAFASFIDAFQDQGFFIQTSDSYLVWLLHKEAPKISPIPNTNKIIDIQIKVLLIKIHIWSTQNL